MTTTPATTTATTTDTTVSVPASSANLGPGFDVLGMALTLRSEFGDGAVPAGAQLLDEHHPGARAFRELGGTGPIWMRSPVPMGRGLGFSAVARVGGASLAAAVSGPHAATSLRSRAEEVLAVATRLEGHGDNAAASLCGGIVASIDGRAVELRIGPTLAAAEVVVWIPSVTTSTDRSRSVLAEQVERSAAVHNLGRLAQLVLAIEHDDPELLAGATSDMLHQPQRLPFVADAAAALDAGHRAGAWCGWLSGSGPSVALLCSPTQAAAVEAALPSSGHTKRLAIDRRGTEIC